MQIFEIVVFLSVGAMLFLVGFLSCACIYHRIQRGDAPVSLPKIGKRKQQEPDEPVRTHRYEGARL